MKSVLLYFPGFNKTIGGSEQLPLMFANWLQGRCRLTFASNVPVDFEELGRVYGIQVDATKMKRIVLDKEANVFERIVGRLFVCTEEMVLHRIGRKYDICISCHGVRDFGRPAVHFLHMLWSHDAKYAAKFNDSFPAKYSWSWWMFFVRRYLRRILPCLPRPQVDTLRDPRETVIPNSDFVKSMLEEEYGIKLAKPFYPPVWFEPVDLNQVKDLNVIYIGRIHEEKGIDTIIGIVKEARHRTGLDVKLYIAGLINDTPYCHHIAARAEAELWIRLLGAVYGDQKLVLLKSNSFAIHVLKQEAFGISVAEYLKAGLVPLVPNSGGAREVVSDAELTYENKDEAIVILTKLLTNPEFLAQKRASCLARGELFSRQNYLARQEKQLTSILEGTQL